MNTFPKVILGDVCDVIAGQSPPGSAYNDAREGLPFYQGKKCFTERVLGPPTVWTRVITKIANPGDILMSVRAPVGPINLATETTCIGRGLAAIRPGEELDRDFLFYQLLQMQSKIAGRNGAVFASINRDDIRALQLALPPLAQQRRIVGILDRVFTDISTATANVEKCLARSGELVEAFLRAFVQPEAHWDERAFEECLQPVKYTTKVQRKDFKSQGAYPIVSQEADFINGYWDNERDVLQVDDPIVVFGDHTRALKYIDFDFVLGADGVKILKPHNFLDTKFLWYVLKAAPLGELGYARHYRLLKERTLRFPPLDEQKFLCERADRLIEETNKLERVLLKKLETLAELKQSILHAAVNGDLTPAEALAA